MTIKELEARAGMDRTNIRYYEREGLLSPARRPNGYRDYTEQDLQQLSRIRLLRGLRVPIEEIRLLQAGQRQLGEVLAQQAERLERQQGELQDALRLCRALCAQQITYGELDAQRFLEAQGTQMQAPCAAPPVPDTDVLPPCPWRRYLARSFDLALCTVAWLAVRGLVLHQPLAASGAWQNWFDGLMGLLLLLFLEPLALHRTGTTPGKALLGLWVETVDGHRMTYGEGLVRTWGVVRAGLGYHIPILAQVRCYQSYRRCMAGRPQPWEEEGRCALRDARAWRGFAYAGGCVVVLGLTVLLFALQMLPPARGDLTVAGFAANYGHYARQMGVTTTLLGPDGSWNDPAGSGVVGMGLVGGLPEVTYLQEGDRLTGVQLVWQGGGDDIWMQGDTAMQLTALALVGAQREVGLFSQELESASRTIAEHGLQSYTFEAAGVQLQCEVTQSGYLMLDSALWPDEGAGPRSYQIRFTARLV